MFLIGENIHIISKTVQESLVSRDEAFVLDLIKRQAHMDYIDLNVGPAKGALEGVLPWLCKLVENNSNLKISFDSRNAEEIEKGLSACKQAQKAIINSTSADSDRIDLIGDLAVEFGSNLIALTMNRELGIPKSADDRLALAFEVFEKCSEKGIENEKIFFDPLILPVSVDQSQAVEALNTIQMIKQSFDPEVMTTIGLSNISNGSPKEIKPIINRVFVVLAKGAGLDSAILDSFDVELIRVLKMLATETPSCKTDKLYLDLSLMMRDFSDIEDLSYDKNDEEQVKIIKTARILLNKDIYSHSFAQS